MKNVKLTLATTLSVLALTFAGAASADNGNRYKDNKRSVTTKTTFTNTLNKNVSKQRVVVKNTPTKKVTVTKKVVTKPAKQQFVSNTRYNKVKKSNHRVNNNTKYNRYQANRNSRTNNQFAISVSPGNTFIQFSF